LRRESRLFGEETRALFYQPQHARGGATATLTLGWHIGALSGRPHFFKEGGGGGFHCTMRVYRLADGDAKLATLVMSNATGFRSNACLDRIDPCFL
jgi:hypothetical protein